MNASRPAAAAIYFARPPGGEATSPIGPDEDVFTLVAAAGELLEREAGSMPVDVIEAVGPFRTEHLETIAIAFGVPGAKVVPRATPAAVEADGSSLESPGRGSRVVVASSLDADSGTGTVAGAVAVRWAPPPARETPAHRPSTPPAAHPLARRIGASGSTVASVFDLATTAHRSVAAHGGAPVGPLSAATWDDDALRGELSEGAYVPHARYLENLPSRWRFAADRCGRCASVTFPRRERCRKCGATEGLIAFELPRNGGTVEAVTTVHAGAQPTEFDWLLGGGGAYDVALVRIHPEARVTLQAVGHAPGSLRSGAQVDTVLRRLYPFEGTWRYGRKAVPAGFTTAE
ncbi:MAG TPA: hypothetical protein VGV89_01875 [Thermoplasmata archaeon]|nr:hypothetical protein [Thermoplasmata archaeon]